MSGYFYSDPKLWIPTGLLGNHSVLDPPDPIPNSEVKRNCADDSVGSPHVKVGHCQALIRKPRSNATGFFFDFYRSNDLLSGLRQYRPKVFAALTGRPLPGINLKAPINNWIAAFFLFSGKGHRHKFTA